MKIFITGAFGNLGSIVTEQLLLNGHSVIAFDIANKTNQKVARSLQHFESLNIAWGDIRDGQQVEALISEVDAVIHLAAVITPFSESNPKLAHEVNVGGTEHILKAIKAATKPPLLVFSSSISIFGPRAKDAPPNTVLDQPKATDNYSQHKIQCEQMVQGLTSPWAIIRLAAMVDSRMRHSNLQQARLAFGLAADNKVEYVHPKDACTAILNILARPAAHNKIHLIGGGKKCQVTHLELMQTMIGAFGIQIEAEDFGDAPFYAHWLDTSEAEQLLEFQHHSLNDFREELYHKFRFLRALAKPASPLIRPILKKLVMN